MINLVRDDKRTNSTLSNVHDTQNHLFYCYWVVLKTLDYYLDLLGFPKYHFSGKIGKSGRTEESRLSIL